MRNRRKRTVNINVNVQPPNNSPQSPVNVNDIQNSEEQLEQQSQLEQQLQQLGGYYYQPIQQAQQLQQQWQSDEEEEKKKGVYMVNLLEGEVLGNLIRKMYSNQCRDHNNRSQNTIYKNYKRNKARTKKRKIKIRISKIGDSVWSVVKAHLQSWEGEIMGVISNHYRCYYLMVLCG